MRWFVRNDLDGFFGLFVDNLVQVVVEVGPRVEDGLQLQADRLVEPRVVRRPHAQQRVVGHVAPPRRLANQRPAIGVVGISLDDRPPQEGEKSS